MSERTKKTTRPDDDATHDQSSQIEAILNRSSILPLVPLLFLAGLLYWQVTTLVDQMEWLDHTDRVIAEAHHVEGILVSQQNSVRGFLLARDDDFLSSYEQNADALPSAIADLGQLVADNPQQARRVESLRDAGAAWQTNHAERLIEMARRGETATLDQLRAARLDAIRTQIDQFVETEEGLRESRLRASRTAADNALWTSIGAIFVIGLALVWFIRRQLASVSGAYGAVLGSARQRAEEIEASERVLSEAMTVYGQHIQRLASGELSSTLDPVGKEDLRILGTNLNGLGSSLAGMVMKMREAVAGLSTATAEILSTTQQQSASASESAAAVAQTAATVDEVSQSAQQTSERARAVAAASRRSLEVSNAGRESVERTVGAITALRTQVDSIAERILALSDQAQLVGQIITTVNELAEQSNLLALNASIEAARAGEHGKSFAVVAQEVRTLAEQSKAATAQVRTILGDIQKSTTAAVLVTEQGSKAAVIAVDAVRDVGNRIEQLAGTIEEASEAAGVIVGAAQQQVTGVGQISQAMHAINLATTQAVEGTRQTERAARDLSELASRLRETAGQFRS